MNSHGRAYLAHTLRIPCAYACVYHAHTCFSTCFDFHLVLQITLPSAAHPSAYTRPGDGIAARAPAAGLQQGMRKCMNGWKAQLAAANATPAELGLPYHLKSDLVEAILVKLLRSERTEAVGISAAVVLFAHAFSWSPQVLSLHPE